MTSRPTIEPDEIQNIAALARLKLSGDECREFTAHFSQVLDFMATLAEVDVEDVAPDFLSGRPWTSLRADTLREGAEPGGPLPRAQVIERAPDSDGPYFTTPRVV